MGLAERDVYNNGWSGHVVCFCEDPTEGDGDQGVRGIWLRRNFRFTLDQGDTLGQEWVDDMGKIKWSIYWKMYL